MSGYTSLDLSKDGTSGQLRELESADLRGKLFINNLQYITDIDDVTAAHFESKIYLEELFLSWGGNRKSAVSHEEVLDAIRPHKNLNRLAIEEYEGKRLSDWIVGVAPSYTNLTYLKISDCAHCETLPSLGSLPCLKELTLSRLHSVKSLGGEFYGDGDNPFNALEKMEILHMDTLETWSFPDGEGFSQLKELQVDDCYMLKNLPYCFPSIVKLYISRCDSVVGIDIHEDGKGLYKRQYGHSLQSIHIYECRQLRSMPKSFPNLEELNMDNNEILASVSRSQNVNALNLNYALLDKHLALGLTSLKHLDLAIGSLTREECWIFLNELVNLKSLTNLVVRHCTLESFPDFELPPTLKFLKIDHWAVLETIPDRFLSRCRQNHVQLRIANCPKLECLTTGLSNLETSDVFDCPIIQLRPTAWWADYYLADLTYQKAEMIQNFIAERTSRALTEWLNESTSLLWHLVVLLYTVETLSNDAKELIGIKFEATGLMEEARDVISDAEKLLQQIFMDLPQSNKASSKMVDSPESSNSTAKWKDILLTVHSYKEIREPEMRRIIKSLQNVVDTSSLLG